VAPYLGKRLLIDDGTQGFSYIFYILYMGFLFFDFFKYIYKNRIKMCKTLSTILPACLEMRFLLYLFKNIFFSYFTIFLV